MHIAVTYTKYPIGKKTNDSIKILVINSKEPI